IINHRFPHKLIPAEPGEDDGPDEPIDTPGDDDADTHYAVDPVRQALVDVLVACRRHEWRDAEVDVAEEEEYDDRESRADRGVPIPGLPVEIEVEKTGGDECVDNGERIRNDTKA